MKLRALYAAAGTLLLVGIAFVSCSLRADTRPNVVLITIDTLRPDHLSIYGSPFGETPAIDRVGHAGAVFDTAHCDVTWTTPSMSSTMTGTYAIHHGFKSPYDRLSDANVTIAEILHDAGYQTGAVIGSYPLDSIYGLDQGFDVYDDTFTSPLLTGAVTTVAPVASERLDDVKAQQDLNFRKVMNDSMRPDDQVTDAALALLARFRSQRRPFFLWVHYFGPHDLPDIHLNAYENTKVHLDSYPAKVTRSDREVGRLVADLDAHDSPERTLLVLHSDHGESLGEHDFIGHGRYLYEDNLHVTLMVRWPAHIPAGRRIAALVGNIDIAPTIADAAGRASATGAMDGRSLLPAVRDGARPHDVLYAETYMPADSGFAEVLQGPDGKDVPVGVRRYGVFSPPWKYVVTEPFPLFGATTPVSAELASRVARTELFNVLLDPMENQNILGAHGDRTERLQTALAELRRGADSRTADKVHVSDEHLEKLRSLGYVQ